MEELRHCLGSLKSQEHYVNCSGLRIQETGLCEFKYNWKLGIRVQMVTKMLASLLFKIGLEHMAYVCGKNGLINSVHKKSPYTVSHRQSWETTCLVQRSRIYPHSTYPWPRQQTRMHASSRQTDPKKILERAKPHTCSSKSKSHSSSQGKSGWGQREARTRRLTHKV